MARVDDSSSSRDLVYFVVLSRYVLQYIRQLMTLREEWHGRVGQGLNTVVLV